MQKIEPGFAIGWDKATWLPALKFWEVQIQNHGWISDEKIGLELGAAEGRISLYLSLKYNCRIICTEKLYHGLAEKFHSSYQTNDFISYLEMDAASIPFENDFFDFIFFKSVLGEVGWENNYPKIEKAISEIHRVLKPGGVLLFAENLQGSLLHRKARQWFVPWGKAWRYLSLAEMHRLLSVFSQYELHTTGFLAAFAPGNERIKSILARIDAALPFIPTNWRYVGYGYALK